MKADRNAEIARRAYHIWESKGRPVDRAVDHWLQAEAEVMAEAASSAAATAAKPSRPARPRRKRKQGKVPARR
jgi:hypothetical protein